MRGGNTGSERGVTRASAPRGAPPNMDHPSQVGAQADRPRAVKPWGPRPLVPAREPARMSSAFRTPRGTASSDRCAQRRMPSIDRHSAQRGVERRVADAKPSINRQAREERPPDNPMTAAQCRACNHRCFGGHPWVPPPARVP